MQIKALGTTIDHITESHLFALIHKWLTDTGFRQIATVNPEMILLARRSPVFERILNGVDLRVVDGVGLQVALRLLGAPSVTRLTGVDICHELLQHPPRNARIFLLGGQEGVAETLSRKYGRKNVVGTAAPPKGTYLMAEDGIEINDVQYHEALIAQIHESHANVLLVALGHGLQEAWLTEHKKKLPQVRVGMGVGGTFDYLAGKVMRAPAILRRAGLEWLWRFFRQPWRAKRIATAVIRFPFFALAWWYSTHVQYRANVVGCILSANGNVLLVARSDRPEHWQFPQGGIEKGESLVRAAKREMREELGLTNLQLLGRPHENAHRYSWPDKTIRLQYGYRGQSQSVVYFSCDEDERITLDSHELSRYRWVPQQELLQVLHPVRRPLGSLIKKDLARFAADRAH